ncbi:MAG: hypothetical protein COB53_04620 [Elusimicrobia bacterium]|nr:MAG: hypothetical protein COB53_04620 [Elusimicrobiota bacterium]
MVLPERERLSEHYRKRFDYISKKYPEFAPKSVAVHMGIIRTSDMLWRVIKKHLREFDLSPPAGGVLLMLDGADPAKTMTEISRELAVTPANITGIVDTLEKRGFVQRIPNPEDRRVFRIGITDAGTKMIRSIAPGYFKLIHSLYSDLDEKESTTLTHALEKVRERLLPLLGAALLMLGTAIAAPASTWTVRESVKSALAVHPTVAEAHRGVDAALSAQLTLLGLYDPSLTASVQRLDSKSAPALIFQTPRTVTDSASLGLTKRFKLGTIAGISTNYSKAKDDSANPFSFNPRHSSSLDLTVSQPLLKGLVGKPERAALRASAQALLAARASHARAAENAAAEVGTAYWKLWQARESIAVFQRSAEEAREFLATTRRLRKTFAAERDDLLRSQADLLSKELEVLDSRESAEERTAELEELTGVNRERLDDAALENPPVPQPLVPSLARALTARTDLAAAKAVAARDAQTLAASEAGFGLPALSLNGAWGWTGLKSDSSGSFEQLGRFGFRTWSLGLDFSYAFGRRVDLAGRTDARAAKLLADVRTTALERLIQREVETASRRLRVSLERVRVTRKLEILQEEVLSLSQKKYSQGRIESRDRLRDANAALAARSARVAAHSEFAQRSVLARAAEGTLLEHLDISP